ncbi:NAD(P)(+)--arginine ADP-ribosyltransferase 2-like isoform X1 [Boleophthalmus pectinirostris]|uniref:NAD(P)(+)--arginine ADP-ribosyltransferase 2-like isoform X1 n=2 Tax=Boleophthalmus pectinirostris TaxID=150288 RepID=UPI00242E12B5|nr:NAD(P)(+)--arginine ADP-ribosyltransferase 2-like isoform X1 [Boleophthalmus pectinirostris]
MLCFLCQSTDMETTVLALMLCLVLPSAVESQKSGTIPLSMMDQSVDDMYDGCSDAMAKKVKRTYFPREKKNNQLFSKAWKQAESCANNKYNTRKNKMLTKDQVQALCVYTAAWPNVYEPFNAAVRVSAANYTTNAFKYHALHYWLVSALQILRINKVCRTTYRRSKDTFTGQKNQEIRFGSFTSTSKNANLTTFGTETCFQITSCLGAYIKDYSALPHEREVLIPPYEKFRIMETAKRFLPKSEKLQANLCPEECRTPQ